MFLWCLNTRSKEYLNTSLRVNFFNEAISSLCFFDEERSWSLVSLLLSSVSSIIIKSSRIIRRAHSDWDIHIDLNVQPVFYAWSCAHSLSKRSLLTCSVTESTHRWIRRMVWWLTHWSRNWFRCLMRLKCNVVILVSARSFVRNDVRKLIQNQVHNDVSLLKLEFQPRKERQSLFSDHHRENEI